MCSNLQVKTKIYYYQDNGESPLKKDEKKGEKDIEISIMGIMIQNLSIGATQSATPDLFCGENVCRKAPEMWSAKHSHRKAQMQNVSHLFTGQNVV